MVSAPSKKTNKLFLAKLSELYPTAAVLSAHLDHYQPFEPPQLTNLPKDLSTLWDPNASDLPLGELLDICSNLVMDISVTDEEIKWCEEATRKQSSNELWFTLRAGRITASNMKKVCVGDVSQPAISTINSICYKGKEVSTAPVVRGKKLEPVARRIYAQNHSKEHTDSSVKECGLFISQAYPFIAASQDGIVRCSCHDGIGGLEIKTTTEENLQACLDASGVVKKDHPFYYQVQTQILVCDLTFCDLFVYTGSSYQEHRVFPDREFHEELVAKSENYFTHVILPELVAKYSSSRGATVSTLFRDTANLGTIICACKAPKAGRTVICAGKECLITEFYMRCAGLTSKPKKKWYCQNCTGI